MVRNCKGVGVAAAALLLLWMPHSLLVKEENFKKCAEAGFCRRNRRYADEAKSQPDIFAERYYMPMDKIHFDEEELQLTGEILDNHHKEKVLVFQIDIYENRVFRLRIDEKRPLRRRHDTAAAYALVGLPRKPSAEEHGTRKVDEAAKTLQYEVGGGGLVVVVDTGKLEIGFVADGERVVAFNQRHFFNFEFHRQPQEPRNDTTWVEDKEDGWWEEQFGGHTDTKPHGPAAVAADISFPGAHHLYGIPEHAGPLSLRPTRGTYEESAYTEPYRLYNLDVSEYEIDRPMALYGSIPVMLAHSDRITAGVFWLNAAETWVDIEKDDDASHTHWISETGALDVFVMLGPTPVDVLRQYISLTGTAALPPYFSVGYHQCRWNYVSEEDVEQVDAGFDYHGIPYDVIWLDIEHTDGKRYFTWDPNAFPHPDVMLRKLHDKQRQLVTIVDPHVKRDTGYYLYREAKQLDLFVKRWRRTGNATRDGREMEDFEGWCWPGTSLWVDFLNPQAHQWWISQFAFDKYAHSAPNLHIWNDMNEPSVFTGPEMTFPKDTLHFAPEGDWLEHRDIHNLNGMLFHRLTAQGLRQRMVSVDGVARRPFVLSRAFFAGSQRHGAVWTGDNAAEWSHLAASVPMLLSLSVTGMSFAGADVGGFFGNPEPELMVRWYQAGALQPFFRAHAHLDTKRREPWLFGEPYTSLIRMAIRLRYALLPYWYTLFFEANRTGLPAIRPMFFVFPHDKAVFSIEDQYLVGNALLVKPITAAGVAESNVYFPANELWYNYFNHQLVVGDGAYHALPVELDKTLLFVRGGTIVPRRDRARRSALPMLTDPVTLLVALDSTGAAAGHVFLDDGESYAFDSGVCIYSSILFTSNGAGGAEKAVLRMSDATSDEDGVPVCKSEAFVEKNPKIGAVRIERVIVVGAAHNYQIAYVTIGKDTTKTTSVSCSLSGDGNRICTIKDPACLLSAECLIRLDTS